MKEDLRRETKRREKATIASKETEEIKLDCEKRVKQLEYSKRCVLRAAQSLRSLCSNTHYQYGLTGIYALAGSWSKRAFQHSNTHAMTQPGAGL